MRYPEFLKENGRIGIIAPSFGCTTEPYESLFRYADEHFRREGYQTVHGPNVFSSSGIGKSNTPERCGEEINDFFQKDLCDVIISAGGGETMCEDLPFVDFPGIAAAKPRWFMGFSDNTNLTLTLPTLCDTAAVYGPMVSAFGQEPVHPAVKDAWNVLTGKTAEVRNYPFWELREDENAPLRAPYNCTERFSSGVYEGREKRAFSEASGRLLGGCLDCMVTLCGTPFDRVKDFCRRYEEDGVLWFIESCDLNPMGARRALWQLLSAGWFDTAKGFLIGRPMHYGEEFMGTGHTDAVLDILGDFGVPVFTDLDIGHLPPAMPVVSGAVGHAEGSEEGFKLRFSFI